MRKMIVILCDGMDYEFVKSKIEEFPTLQKFYKNNRFKKLESVIPVDSVPSWNTIYTGMNPCEHGILDDINYIDYKNNLEEKSCWAKGKTFWDKLEAKGNKCLVVNPFMAFPSWNINGIMISGPVFEGGDYSTNCASFFEGMSIPDLGGITDYPYHKDMRDFYNKTFETTKQQFDFFYECLKKDNFDFAFLGILTLDRLQHFLWRYTDTTDIRYKKDVSLTDSILNVYKYIDSQIEYLNKEFKEYDILLLSDHGHGKRCEKTFYINQFLIENNIIPNISFKKRIIEYIKHIGLYTLFKLKCVGYGTKKLKNIKILHRFKNSDYGEKKDLKQVSVPNFSGVNPYGGIKIEKSLFKTAKDFENKKAEIINVLSCVKDGQKNIVEWVKRREELYLGDRSNLYPEIIFKLDDNYGVDRGYFGKRKFGISYFHEIISGGHKFNGVILSTLNIDKLKNVQCISDFIINYYNE